MCNRKIEWKSQIMGNMSNYYSLPTVIIKLNEIERLGNVLWSRIKFKSVFMQSRKSKKIHKFEEYSFDGKFFLQFFNFAQISFNFCHQSCCDITIFCISSRSIVHKWKIKTVAQVIMILEPEYQFKVS